VNKDHSLLLICVWYFSGVSLLEKRVSQKCRGGSQIWSSLFLSTSPC